MELKANFAADDFSSATPTPIPPPRRLYASLCITVCASRDLASCQRHSTVLLHNVPPPHQPVETHHPAPTNVLHMFRDSKTLYAQASNCRSSERLYPDELSFNPAGSPSRPQRARHTEHACCTRLDAYPYRHVYSLNAICICAYMSLCSQQPATEMIAFSSRASAARTRGPASC